MVKKINFRKIKKLIPSGSQLLSKRPELYSEKNWPCLFKKSKGCYVWGIDDQKYLDMSTMSVGACLLGYSDNDVDKKVISIIKKGVNSSLISPEEYTLAKKLIQLHPWSSKARFARSGGEAMQIAVRIARAFTKKDLVLFSGYHGWNDWYISSNLSNKKNLDGMLLPGLPPLGVPRDLKNSAIPFNLYDLKKFRMLVKKYKTKIAAIVLEPAKENLNTYKQLKEIKSIANKLGAVLIFDEITTGFRMCNGGIHKILKINPDICVFAKSIANGYAMSAIIGKSKIMNAAENTFISSTNWTERVGPVAALATIEKYEKKDVQKHIVSIGKLVKKIWQNTADKYKIKISIQGIDSLPSFEFIGSKKNKLQVYFVNEMLKHKILAFKQFRPSYSHKVIHLEKYKKALNKVFKKISLLKKHEINKIKKPLGFFKRPT